MRNATSSGGEELVILSLVAELQFVQVSLLLPAGLSSEGIAKYFDALKRAGAMRSSCPLGTNEAVDELIVSKADVEKNQEVELS